MKPVLIDTLKALGITAVLLVAAVVVFALLDEPGGSWPALVCDCSEVDR